MATMLYHQTKDILYIMNFLCRRNIKGTMVYIPLEEVLFKNVDEGVVCKVASTVEEAKPLIEVGFDYPCEVNGVKLFRKRKGGSGLGESQNGPGEI